MFDKKAFGNEIDLSELASYFKECDLYPAQPEIDEAVDAVFRGGYSGTRYMLCSEVGINYGTRYMLCLEVGIRGRQMGIREGGRCRV